MNIINAYLLNFGNTAIKRISYAASFGKEKGELDNDFINIFTLLLKNFNYVSVRERAGLDICKQCGIDGAEWVPDPTILLDADMYRSLYRDEEIIKKTDKPYCFLYLVGNEFNLSIGAIYDWARRKRMEIVYVTGNSRGDKHEKTYATIPEWIYFLEHAEYVITNSYHCTIFSLLFRKEFAIVPLSGKSAGMNSRFDTIFQLFGIENRYISVDFSVFDRAIDWQMISNALQNIKSSCKFNTILQ